jgi:hypothetical protein
MSNSISDILPDITLKEPASPQLLEAMNVKAGVQLPSAYLDILHLSNGLAGPIDKYTYIILWPIEEVIQNNEEYATREFLPNVFLIGSDGGEIAYGLDLRASSNTYSYFIAVPFLDMDWSEVLILGNTFPDFVSKLKEGIF